MNKEPLPKVTTVPDKQYDRPTYKTVLRICGFLILTVLNISLVGSDLSRIQNHEQLNLQLEALTFLAVIFFDASILVPILFEVRKIRFWEDRIVLNTLFWQTQLAWADIKELKLPLFFAVAVIKTNRTFYIINRQDFKEFPDFIQKIEGKIGVQQKRA